MAEILETQERFPVRPPWMAEILETQERFPVRPPWMAEILETQERFPVKRESGIAVLPGSVVAESPLSRGRREQGLCANRKRTALPAVLNDIYCQSWLNVGALTSPAPAITH